MNNDGFERKLQQQPLGQIPSDWRGSILRAAQERAGTTAQPPKPALIRAVVIAWRELFQPCRYAWSGLAAVWLMIWMVNAHTQITQPPPRIMASTRARSERIRFFEEQRRVLVELTGPMELSPAETLRRAHPKPRSERLLG